MYQRHGQSLLRDNSCQLVTFDVLKGTLGTGRVVNWLIKFCSGVKERKDSWKISTDHMGAREQFEHMVFALKPAMKLLNVVMMYRNIRTTLIQILGVTKYTLISHMKENKTILLTGAALTTLVLLSAAAAITFLHHRV